MAHPPCAVCPLGCSTVQQSLLLSFPVQFAQSSTLIAQLRGSTAISINCSCMTLLFRKSSCIQEAAYQRRPWSNQQPRYCAAVTFVQQSSAYTHVQAHAYYLWVQVGPLLALHSAHWPEAARCHTLLFDIGTAMQAVAAAGSRAGSSLVLCVAARCASQ